MLSSPAVTRWAQKILIQQKCGNAVGDKRGEVSSLLKNAEWDRAGVGVILLESSKIIDRDRAAAGHVPSSCRAWGRFLLVFNVHFLFVDYD